MLPSCIFEFATQFFCVCLNLFTRHVLPDFCRLDFVVFVLFVKCSDWIRRLLLNPRHAFAKQRQAYVIPSCASARVHVCVSKIFEPACEMGEPIHVEYDRIVVPKQTESHSDLYSMVY